MVQLSPLKINDFQFLHSNGRWVHYGVLSALYLFDTSSHQIRISVNASKKAGNAVRRNRLKRVLRAGMRATFFNMPCGLNILLCINKKAPNYSFSLCTEDIRAIIKKIMQNKK